jgi:hypothetical protein
MALLIFIYVKCNGMPEEWGLLGLPLKAAVK